jgi:diguanylate cyclase (GGDEF)-like protein
MGRQVSRTTGRTRMSEDGSPSAAFDEKRKFFKHDGRYRATRRVLVMDRKLRTQESSTGEAAPSFLARGNDLLQILEEVNDISKSLKSNPADAQALSEALRRTVLCAIKQSILEKDLRSLALTDDLTSLYNRRAFYALAAQQLKVMRRKGEGLLLFFADVDQLKDINDRYGHKEGDIALVRTAGALERTFRRSDIVARLSGDEFAVLALEASGQGEDAILRRFKEHLQIANAEEDRYELSVSVGVARFNPKHSVSLGDLLEKADEAMYARKSARGEIRMTRTRTVART